MPSQGRSNAGAVTTTVAGGSGSNDAPPTLTNDELGPLLHDPAAQAWFEEHMSELRQDAYGQRILYFVLAIVFVVGIVAYLAGYVVKSTTPAEPFALLSDLLYAFGFALWTAAVVVVLVEVIPEVKRRQIRRALEAYEAIRREDAAQKEKADQSLT